MNQPPTIETLKAPIFLRSSQRRDAAVVKTAVTCIDKVHVIRTTTQEAGVRDEVTYTVSSCDGTCKATMELPPEVVKQAEGLRVEQAISHLQTQYVGGVAELNSPFEGRMIGKITGFGKEGEMLRITVSAAKKFTGRVKGDPDIVPYDKWDLPLDCPAFVTSLEGTVEMTPDSCIWRWGEQTVTFTRVGGPHDHQFR